MVVVAAGFGGPGTREGRTLLLVLVWLAAAPGLLAARPATAADPGGCHRGYRRERVLEDFTLSRAWMVLADCEHPERPRVAVALGTFADAANRPPEEGGDPGPFDPGPVDRSGPPPPGESWALPGAKEPPPASPPVARAAAKPPAVVRSGGRVMLWRRERNARIELAGIALADGAAGSPIRVRVALGGRVLAGVVRGPGSVELEFSPPGRSSGGWQ